METAIGYIRVSHIRQVEDGNSLETQELQVREHMDRHGYENGGIFIERGESAKTDNRTELKQMLEFVREHEGQITVVVIPRIDRLARNVYDYASLKLRLRQFGVRLESVSERLEDTPVGRFTESVLASTAQFDNEVRAERSKNGMIQAVRDGRWVWQAPVGFRNVRMGAFRKKRGVGTIEPDPTEAPLVLEAFKKLASGGYRAREVLHWLSDQGLPLSRTAFHVMLSNPVYIGKIEAFGGVFDAEPPFVALVDEATFRLAQAHVSRSNAGKARPYDRLNPDFPLRGTAKCTCGSFLTASWSRGSKGTRYPYYRCLSCARLNVPAMKLEEAFEAVLDGLFPVGFSLLEVGNVLGALDKQERQSAEETHNVLLKQLQALRGKQVAISRKVLDGTIPDDVARELQLELKEEAEQVKDQMAKATRRQLPPLPVFEFGHRLLQELQLTWRNSSSEEKRKLQAVLFPDGLTFDQSEGFRTPYNSLWEQLKESFAGLQFSLVDHANTYPNPRESLIPDVLDLTTRVFEAFNAESLIVESRPSHGEEVAVTNREA